MKHWILGLIFMIIAIVCGFELGKQFTQPDKNWLNIGFFGIMCVAATYFYFKERTKRSAFFKERMERENKNNK